MVAHLQRHDKHLRCLSALERLSLQQEYEAEYGVDGERDTYWHHIKLLTAFDIQALVCDMLSKEQKSCNPITFDMPKTRTCASCGQNVDRTCGCWFTEDGETILPYVVMPKAVAEEIWILLSRDQLIQDRLLQPDVVQTGTAFLDKQKHEQLDKKIRNLWRDLVPVVQSAFEKMAVDMTEAINDGRVFVATTATAAAGAAAVAALQDLQFSILQYNAPQNKHCKTLPLLLDQFILQELMHVDLANQYFTQETRGFVLVNGNKVHLLSSLKTESLARLSQEWRAFNLSKAIIDYVMDIASLQLKLNLDQFASEAFSDQLKSRVTNFRSKFGNAVTAPETIRAWINAAIRSKDIQSLNDSFQDAQDRFVVLERQFKQTIAPIQEYLRSVEAADKNMSLQVDTDIQALLQQIDALNLGAEFRQNFLQRLATARQELERVRKLYKPVLTVSKTFNRFGAQDLAEQELEVHEQTLDRLKATFQKLLDEMTQAKELEERRKAELKEREQLRLESEERQRKLEAQKRAAEDERKRAENARRMQALEQQRLKREEEARRKSEEQRASEEAEALRLAEIEEQRLLAIERRKEEIAKEQNFLDAEKKEEVYVELITDLLYDSENENWNAVNTSLKQLFELYGNDLILKGLDNELVGALLWLLKLTNKQGALVSPPETKNKNYIRALIAAGRFLFTNKENFLVDAWNYGIDAKLHENDAKTPGYTAASDLRKRGQFLVDQVQSTGLKQIVPTNFKWDSKQGGSCAFDALFNGMFKVPGTWLEQQIMNAKQVYPEDGVICDAKTMHQFITQDINYLHSQGEEKRFCFARDEIFKCLGRPVDQDDPREVLSYLVQFYNLQNNVDAAFGIGLDEFNTVIDVNYLPASAETQILMFQVENVGKMMLQKEKTRFTVPKEIGDFTLLCSFAYGGGHWWSYVRDPTTDVWWKFDALFGPNAKIGDTSIPDVVLQGKPGEQPAAYVYVRKPSVAIPKTSTTLDELIEAFGDEKNIQKIYELLKLPIDDVKTNNDDFKRQALNLAGIVRDDEYLTYLIQVLEKTVNDSPDFAQRMDLMFKSLDKEIIDLIFPK